MVRYALIGLMLACSLWAGDSMAEALMRPAPVDAFIPLHADATGNALPWLHQSARFIALPKNQMSVMVPRVKPVAMSAQKEAANPPAPGIKSSAAADMTEDQAKQILSLFSASH